MDNSEFYKKVVERYLDGTASREEQEVFVHLLNQGKLDGYLRMGAEEEEPVALQHRSEPLSGRMKRLHALRKYGVAAAVVLTLGLGTLLRIKHKDPERIAATKNDFKNDVLPGGSHAVLTLADGSRIALDSAKKGDLPRQGSARVVKLNAGSLSYKTVGNGTAAVYYNTVATPAGGQYEITLADGTRVWLNALSGLRFPTAFTGQDRTVQLSGEAYFEIAKDRKRPFHVTVNGVDVQVLGTTFNVNAYPDEPCTKTTLVEGSVKLVRGKDNITLRPGQMGQVTGSGAMVLVKDADVDQALAWKNGYFSFEGADIQMIMRQIARWYDVTVRYEGNPGSRLFEGQIGRDLNLSEVLTGLSKSHVHFKLDGTVLTVLP